MTRGRIHSPNEICRLLNISKTTLFRWEEEGGLPQVPRDPKGRRLYGDEHILAISQRLLGKQFERVAESKVNQQVVLEALALTKFLGGDMTGLFELAECPRLSFQTIRGLMGAALEQYEPGEATFCEIIKMIYRQTCQEADLGE